MIRMAVISAVGFLFATSLLDAAETISRGDGIAASVSRDGRVAMDLLGDLWIVPPNGGRARAITKGPESVRRPRWSPDASQIVYQSTSRRAQGIWIYDFATNRSRRISRGAFFDAQPAWHPGGERIIYASDATDSGFDLWEVDLPSGLHWRLSDYPGDETEPAWSRDGRDLVYVHHNNDQWSLILRRLGLPEEALLTSTDKLAGPSWRPDGSLITFLRTRAGKTSINMVILSRPRLIRSYASGEKFEPAPVSWVDRHRMVYTADGEIRQRLFNSWSSTPLPFEATLVTAQPASLSAGKRRQLPLGEEPTGRLVVHASRMFDGLGGGYQQDTDIVVDGGRIVAVEPHRDHVGANIVDMGDLTVLPGYIDANANLTSGIEKFAENMGPLLLTSGVTTVVAQLAQADRLNRLWSGKTTPGPRILNAADWPVSRVSGMADSTTPGLAALLESRQARLLAMPAVVRRRFAEPPGFAAGASTVVLGSADNELPPGIALHAEFRALAAAGLSQEQVLRAAGANAAAALHLDLQLGRIAVGAAADLVFVDGDPLARVEDTLKIVAVVRNGRFYSVRGLIDRVQTGESVE